MTNAALNSQKTCDETVNGKGWDENGYFHERWNVSFGMAVIQKQKKGTLFSM